MQCRRWRRKRQQEKPAQPTPVKFFVIDIRVSDDGFSLTGRRFSGYLAEVLRRQEAGIPQDAVMVWYHQSFPTHVQGFPKVNDARELEVYATNLLLGTVREVGDKLWFFPA